MKEIKEVKKRIPVCISSKLVGKTISELEKSFKISVLELENNSDRAFIFSWEEKPNKSLTIKSEDEIVVFGRVQRIEHFSKIAASLN